MLQSIWEALSGKAKGSDTVAKKRTAETPAKNAAEKPAAASASPPANVNGAAKNANGQVNGHVSIEAIRMRAYLKWEAAGKPKGQDDRFWHEAEKELSQGS